MSLESKVVWTEGMFLNPQHFQQQNRYTERLIHGRCDGLQLHGWGLQVLELDRALLNLGKVAIRRARGVFPDGTPFDFPDYDDAAPVMTVPESARGQVVYLAVPVRRPGSADALPPDSRESLARYQVAEQNVRDDTMEGGDSQTIQVGKLRLRLLLESDDLSGYTCIGVLRVAEVSPENDVVIDDRFIPPLLNAKTDQVLSGFLEELHGLLRHRAESIAGRLADARRGGTAEVADYLLLQVINRAEPLIRHYSQCRQLHPLPLFETLLQLTGELATFVARERRPPPLPDYRHADLEQTLLPVVQTLRQYLSMVYEQTAISLSLIEKKYGVFVSEIPDRSLLASAQYVLAVRADLADDFIRSQFPAQIKIGPVERIRQLVNAALPGIVLKPLPVAPREIPFRAGFTYFELDKHGQFWKEMHRSGGFAMHVGGEFPGLTMEFWAIRQ